MLPLRAAPPEWQFWPYPTSCLFFAPFAGSWRWGGVTRGRSVCFEKVHSKHRHNMALPWAPSEKAEKKQTTVILCLCWPTRPKIPNPRISGHSARIRRFGALFREVRKFLRAAPGTNNAGDTHTVLLVCTCLWGVRGAPSPSFDWQLIISSWAAIYLRGSGSPVKYQTSIRNDPLRRLGR